MLRSPRISAALVLALAVACKPAEKKEEAAAAPPAPPEPAVVTVNAQEYAYSGPDTIAAGLTTFRLVNTGKELHHMTIMRLNDGKTMQDLMAVPDGPTPSWLVAVGGPNAAAPGDTANATVNMEAGNYAVMCFIPSADGKPHMMKGMVRQLVVQPSSALAAATPSADVTISLSDYAFNLSTPLTAGHHTIKVENTAKQDHELVLVQLLPGKKASDFTTWAMTMKGPPPGRPLSGMAGLAPGQSAYVTDDFTPGTYVLVCFAPDATDGKAHVAHGMVQELTIS